VFSALSVQSGHKEVEFGDASLPGYEHGSRGFRIESNSGDGSCGRELREMAVEGD
jgi:hypothetical protein